MPRSRLYDVWSIGCIFLEFVVWLLKGRVRLERFTQHAMGLGAYFYLKPDDTPQAEINEAVQACLDGLLQDEAWTEGTSIGDLIHVVAHKMLVVRLPQACSFSEDTEDPQIAGPWTGEADEGQQLGLSMSPEASLIIHAPTAPAPFNPAEVRPLKLRANALKLQ
ncbi:hypothetical protein PG993_003880 [Apiospora rasikravindrae]|uniref:Protein kinase domain-containing protein n=1 Tax=Apiospora rasikravindrae TaxID=990691 RepID=A0ABR1U0R5_9PEZI